MANSDLSSSPRSPSKSPTKNLHLYPIFSNLSLTDKPSLKNKTKLTKFSSISGNKPHGKDISDEIQQKIDEVRRINDSPKKTRGKNRTLQEKRDLFLSNYASQPTDKKNIRIAGASLGVPQSTLNYWKNQYNKGITSNSSPGPDALPPLTDEESDFIKGLYCSELECKGKYPTDNYLWKSFRKAYSDSSIGIDRFRRNLELLGLKTAKDIKKDKISSRNLQEKKYGIYNKDKVIQKLDEWRNMNETMFNGSIKFKENCIFVGRTFISIDNEVVEYEKEVNKQISYEFATAFDYSGYFEQMFRNQSNFEQLFNRRKESWSFFKDEKYDNVLNKNDPLNALTNPDLSTSSTDQSDEDEDEDDTMSNTTFFAEFVNLVLENNSHKAYNETVFIVCLPSSTLSKSFDRDIVLEYVERINKDQGTIFQLLYVPTEAPTISPFVKYSYFLAHNIRKLSKQKKTSGKPKVVLKEAKLSLENIKSIIDKTVVDINYRSVDSDNSDIEMSDRNN